MKKITKTTEEIINDLSKSSLCDIKNNLRKSSGYTHSPPLNRAKKLIESWMKKYDKKLSSKYLNIKSIDDYKDFGSNNLYLDVLFGYGDYTKTLNCNITEDNSVSIKFLYQHGGIGEIETDVTIYDLEQILTSDGVINNL